MKKSAFSLVELIVVMAIAMIIMSLGLSQLFILQERSVIRSTMNEFIDAIATSRNQARNISVSLNTEWSEKQKDDAVLTSVQNFSYKAMVIENGTFVLGDCKDSSGGVSFECVFASESNKTLANEGISIDAVNYAETNVENCRAIIFSPGLSQGSFAVTGGNRQSLVISTGTEVCYYSFYKTEKNKNTGLILEYNVQTNETTIL